MTDTSMSPIISTKPSNYERIKETSNKFYTNKIHNNAEFYEKEKQRVREYMKNRYNNDPEYAEKKRQKTRERHLINKLKRQEATNTAQNIVSVN